MSEEQIFAKPWTTDSGIINDNLDCAKEQPSKNELDQSPVDLRLEECRLQFARTGNGVWAWEGIQICLGRYMARYGGVPPRPFPEWIREYLGNAATDIVDLGNLRDPANRPELSDFNGDHFTYDSAMVAWRRKFIPATDAGKHALKALKLGGSAGKSMFAEYDSQNKDLITAISVEFIGREATRERAGLKDISQIDKRKARGLEIRPTISDND